MNSRINLINTLYFIISTGSFLQDGFGNFFTCAIFLFNLLYFIDCIYEKKAFNYAALLTLLFYTTLLVVNFLFSFYTFDWLYYAVFFLHVFIVAFSLLFYGNVNNLLLSLHKGYKVVMLLGILNFIITNLFNFLFVQTNVGGTVHYTLFHIFNFASEQNLVLFNIYRNQGIFTEPGIFAAHLCFAILFSIELKDSFYLKVAIFLLISSFSSMGFGILVLISLINYLKYFKNLSYWFKFFSTLFLSFILILSWYIYTQKFVNNISHSLNYRYFDLINSIDIIKKHLLFGIGLSPSSYFLYLKNSMDIDLTIFDIDISESYIRGNTNSLLGLFSSLGVPISIIYLYRLFKQKLIVNNKYIFFISLIFILSSEPLIFNPLLLLIFSSNFFKKYSDVNFQKKMV